MNLDRILFNNYGNAINTHVLRWSAVFTQFVERQTGRDNFSQAYGALVLSLVCAAIGIVSLCFFNLAASWPLWLAHCFILAIAFLNRREVAYRREGWEEHLENLEYIQDEHIVRNSEFAQRGRLLYLIIFASLTAMLAIGFGIFNDLAGSEKEFLQSIIFLATFVGIVSAIAPTFLADANEDAFAQTLHEYKESLAPH